MSLSTELCHLQQPDGSPTFFQHWNFLSDIFHKTSKLGLLWVSGNRGLSRLASSTKSGGPHGAATELWVAGSAKETTTLSWLHVTTMDGATPTLPPLQSFWVKTKQSGSAEAEASAWLTAWAAAPTARGPAELPYFHTSFESHRNIIRRQATSALPLPWSRLTFPVDMTREAPSGLHFGVQLPVALPRWLMVICIFFFFFATSCGLQDPWPEIEPCPQQQKHQALTTGPPGNSQICIIFMRFTIMVKCKNSAMGGPGFPFWPFQWVGLDQLFN